MMPFLVPNILSINNSKSSPVAGSPFSDQDGLFLLLVTEKKMDLII